MARAYAASCSPRVETSKRSTYLCAMASMSALSDGEAFSFIESAFCTAAKAKGDSPADITWFRLDPQAQASPQ